MPAGIEIDETTGRAAVAVARTPAWHRLGFFKAKGGGLTADEVLDKAYLRNWHLRVDEEPVRNNNGVPIPGKFAINRDNPFTGEEEPLGVSGKVWRPFQNEELLPLLDDLRGQTNGEFETAGSLYGGRAVFITCRLPEGMLIGGVDPMDRYLTLIDYKDATSALVLLDTWVRSVCANTVNAALANYLSKVTIWHTESGRQSVMQIREALGITFAFDEALEIEMERMAAAPCRESDFVRGIRKIWTSADEDSKRAQTNQKKRELDLVSLFLESETNTTIRGTKWGAYNAVTEYLDWTSPVPSTHPDADATRALRTASPDSKVNELKADAFATFRVPALSGKRAAS